MSYSFNSRVRYSELGESSCLSLPGVLDYFQDCSTFQSESIGQGMKILRDRGRVWVLSAWQVVIERYPCMGEDIVISTWPYEFGGFKGLRNFTMDTADGERLAYADSYWTYLNLEKGFPVKLTEADTRGYILEQKLDMEYAPRKIALPEHFSAAEPFTVQQHHLDTNHHVNNCQYVVMAEDYLPEGFTVRRLRVEYKQQARLHHVINPRYAVEEDRVVILLEDDNNKPYAVVEFK